MLTVVEKCLPLRLRIGFHGVVFQFDKQIIIMYCLFIHKLYFVFWTHNPFLKLLLFIPGLPVVLSRAICSMLKPDPSNVGSANSVIVTVMLSADRLRRVPDVAHECATLAWHVPSCTHCEVASTWLTCCVAWRPVSWLHRTPVYVNDSCVSRLAGGRPAVK